MIECKYICINNKINKRMNIEKIAMLGYSYCKQRHHICSFWMAPRDFEKQCREVF